MRHRSLGLLAVIALMLAGCGAGVAEPGGPSEGIQVHGDWTVSVYNEDGTLDEHLEFSNALSPTGDDLLANLLSRSRTPGGWAILAGGATGTETPCGTSAPATCEIPPVGLTVTADAGVLTLAGSFDATRDGNIGVVQTTLGSCSPDTSPEQCSGNGGGGQFTHKVLVPVAISAGQTVEIQVEISFTTG